MISGSVARRYAKALYELASQEGGVEDAAASLEQLATAVGDLDEGTLSPGVLDADARQKLGAALAAPFGGGTLGKFIQLLADRDRLEILPNIHEWFERIRDEADGRVRLTVTSATELDAGEIDSVVAAFKKIAGGNVTAEVNTDPSLLGGAVVEVQGRVYDGSIKTRLTRLAAKMAGDA